MWNNLLIIVIIVCAASKMTTIKSNNKSENKDDSVLYFGKENNFTAWKERQTDICGALYGKQANVLKNYKPHVIRAVTSADYTPAEAETDSDDEPAQFTAVAILQKCMQHFGAQCRSTQNNKYVSTRNSFRLI